MKNFILLVFLCFSFSAFSFSQTPENIPQVQTFYVSETGQDAGHTGTYSDPFATIHYALSQVDYHFSGLVIKVIKGANGYNQYVHIDKSGNANFPIIIQAEDPNNKPVFKGSQQNIFINANAVFNWSHNCNYITIENIIIKDVNANNKIQGIWIRGDNDTIRNCELYNLAQGGILIQGNFNVIERNYIHDITGENENCGNNISIETYKDGTNSDAWTANYNIIRDNKITNNPTHFGVNIFPDTKGAQDIMYGNKIYNNYIDYTGGGIYTRYQKDIVIINNVISNSIWINNQYADWTTTGSGISFEFLVNSQYSNTNIIEESNVKIYNNTIVNNAHIGIDNHTSNGVAIKNNIIANNALYHIAFRDFNEIITANISNNLYYSSGTQAQWMWNGVDKNWSEWHSTYELSAQNSDPLFTNQTGTPYTIQLHSPAKNSGTPLAEVTKDIKGINRPYWENGVDIGAYELDEAQIRVGTINVTSGQDITHTITAYGTYWEKNGTSWPISTASDISTSSYTTIGTTSSDKEEWDGFHIKWLRNLDNQAPFGHAFYKVFNSYSNNYFYIDIRDAIISYTPNVYLRYSNIGYTHYEYYDGNLFQPINDGAILRIWNINGAINNTSNLDSYFGNMLIRLENNNHPRLVWGPGSSNNQYTLRLAIDNEKPENIFSNQNILEYYDQTLDLSGPDYPSNINANYSIASGSLTSNTVTYSIINPENKKNILKDIPKNYLLSQNYPNPFNPNTTIRYSIKDAGLVKIEIFDILGRKVATIVNEEKPAGNYEVGFNGNNLSSGIYIFKLISGAFTDIKKMQLIK